MGKSYAIDDRGQLHKDANRMLDDNLLPGEPVRVIIPGQLDSAVIGTDRRLFVFKKGALSGSMFGKKLSSWDYRNVTGVQIETGVMTGTVTVEAAGASRTGSTANARGSENAIALSRREFDTARAAVPVLRQVIAEHHTPTGVPDAADQLRKLGELRDSGILTPAEFDAKKGELLARL